jgi:nitrate/nitrite transporter NarK
MVTPFIRIPSENTADRSSRRSDFSIVLGDACILKQKLRRTPAMINSIANLGGFFGPNVIGQLEASTGSFSPGMLVVSAAALALAAVLALLVPVDSGPDRLQPEAVHLEPVQAGDA